MFLRYGLRHGDKPAIDDDAREVVVKLAGSVLRPVSRFHAQTGMMAIWLWNATKSLSKKASNPSLGWAALSSALLLSYVSQGICAFLAP